MRFPILISILCTCLLLPLAVIAQGTYRDSLLQEISTETDAEKRIRLKFELARDYGLTDTSLMLGHEILAESKAIGFLKGEAFAHEIRSYSYYNLDQMEESLIEDSLHIIVQQKLGNNFAVGAIYSIMGATNVQMRRLDQGIACLLKSAEVMEQEENYDWLARVYNDLGEALDLSEQPTEALYYLRAGLALRKEYSDPSSLHFAYTDLGNFFSTSNELDSALYYHGKALENSQAAGDEESMAISYQNMGNALQIAGQYEKSIPYLLKANAYFEEGKRIQYLAPNYNSIAEAYGEIGRYAEAIDYLNRTLEMTKADGPLNLAKAAHEILADIYKKNRDFEQAFFHLEQQKILEDSLLKEQNLEVIAGLERKYQNQQQKTQIAKQELELERQNRLRNYTMLGAGFVVLCLFIAFQYFRNRQKNKVRKAAMEAQLERAESEKLRELDQLKSTFFANISHEFRTPLTLILGPIQQALLGTTALGRSDSEEVTVKASYLQVIERNAERLLQLVNQLLDLSRADGGQLKLVLRQGDVLALIRAIVFSFESLAERRNIEYQTTFPEQLETAIFDQDKWEKILINLLANAFKFTPEGGILSFRAEARAGGLEMVITDTGPGIKAKDLPHIFDRFYQVEGTEARGTGIGLALVRELVELQEGRVEVQSELGQGTEFKVLLPYLPEHFTKVDTTTLLSENTGPPSVDLKTPTPVIRPQEVTLTEEEAPLLLIVEDNADLRYYISDQLGAAYRILTAENGKLGLESAIEHTPDLIISDVMMPEMDGFALCERLKSDQRTSHIPVILLTAKAGQDHKLTGLETGADEYLTKPFDGRELNLRVKNLIQQRAQLRERYSQFRMLAPKDIAVTSADEQFLQQVQEVIEDNIANEQFSVEDLAAAVAFSRSQLHRKLKSLTDQSPIGIIRDFRLQRAKSLLEQGAGNVSEIALAVGYANLSYFSKSFKAAFGILPSEVA